MCSLRPASPIFSTSLPSINECTSSAVESSKNRGSLAPIIQHFFKPAYYRVALFGREDAGAPSAIAYSMLALTSATKSRRSKRNELLNSVNVSFASSVNLPPPSCPDLLIPSAFLATLREELFSPESAKFAKNQMNKKINKIVLAYSGGLDTSAMLLWLKGNLRLRGRVLLRRRRPGAMS